MLNAAEMLLCAGLDFMVDIVVKLVQDLIFLLVTFIYSA